MDGMVHTKTVVGNLLPEVHSATVEWETSVYYRLTEVVLVLEF